MTIKAKRKSKPPRKPAARDWRSYDHRDFEAAGFQLLTYPFVDTDGTPKHYENWVPGDYMTEAESEEALPNWEKWVDRRHEQHGCQHHQVHRDPQRARPEIDPTDDPKQADTVEEMLRRERRRSVPSRSPGRRNLPRHLNPGHEYVDPSKLLPRD